MQGFGLVFCDLRNVGRLKTKQKGENDMFTYSTKGTCSRQILFDVDENNKMHNVRFIGGCGGNPRA